MSVRSDLQVSRDRIQDKEHWTKKYDVLNKDKEVVEWDTPLAYMFCMTGAVRMTVGDNEDKLDRAISVIAQAIRQKYVTPCPGFFMVSEEHKKNKFTDSNLVQDFNDDKLVKHADVLEIMDLAIQVTPEDT